MGIHGLVEKKDIYLGNEKILEKLSLSNRYQKEAQELVEQGDSLLYIVVNQQLVGVLGVKDIVREDAKRTIHTLQKMGKEVIMLTGDHEKTAQLIASSLGIQKVISNVLPKEKTKFIQKLIQEGAVVMMVGDGINDAPSLASADIGVSIHSGTDIASDSSDVILMKDQIEKIPLLLRIGQKTILNIKENLFWAFFYNIIMLPIAIGFFKPWGITMNPMVASLAMTCSSLTVVWNALRLRKIS